MSLRSNYSSPIFGTGCELPKNVLPTYSDVMKYYVFVSVARCAEKGRQDLLQASCDIVATEIENIWKRDSLPIVQHKTIVSKIRSYHDKHRALLKSNQKSKDNKNYKQKLQKFKEDCEVFFDIASCKCKSLSTCSCDKTRKIPKQEHEFLLDQRGERRMMIGSLNKKATLKNMALSDRKLKRKQFKENSMSLQIHEPEQKRNKTKTSSVINVTSIVPAINIPGPSKFPVVAMTLDRYGISDRAGAAIVSTTLQDIGLVTESDTSSVIDRSKILRARAQTRNSGAAVNVLDGDNSLVCISFDGRKDKTILYEDNRRKPVVEEHITLVK
ncbi:unnamed protein product [Parnassius apollo]|uniref:(apollo) hypothetical protein n=1 Tax=Parnassius apollo TaxID=110799 RepID=A0A8S3W0H0_PARAO|nr:unnamed protein product [Parnassius apollo]